MNRKEDPAVQVFSYYKERYNFLEAKKYYVLATPSRKDMETRKYKKQHTKFILSNTLFQYSIKKSRKSCKKSLRNKKRELKTLFFYLFNFNYFNFINSKSHNQM